MPYFPRTVFPLSDYPRLDFPYLVDIGIYKDSMHIKTKINKTKWKNTECINSSYTIRVDTNTTQNTR